MTAEHSSPPTIWTIGHSTREIDEFVRLLLDEPIELLVDVRRFPGSRRLPHFGREMLEAQLARAGVGYRWMPELGGRRRPHAGSRNTGWRNDAFRGYADYMETEAFTAALEELVDTALQRRTAIMCAEALWWQCHRRLISDALVARGWRVVHIRAAGATEPHRLQAPARIVGGELSYESEAEIEADQPKLDL